MIPWEVRKKEILKRALEVEEKGKKEWEWLDVQAHPAELVKLVCEGLIRITYTRGRRKKYQLTEKGRKLLSPRGR